MTSRAQDVYQRWLNHPALDEATREELKAIQGDRVEIEDRFYQDLQFGTAGLRGIMGAGTNRMNRYTVARAAEGFAKSLIKQDKEGAARGIAISYDPRNRSREFAELVASIFVNNGIAVHFSDMLRPVPMLSFAVRHFNCIGGVMITASHNPKEYNGFKAYGSDGAQLGPADADRAAAEMAKVKDLPVLLKNTPSFEKTTASPLFSWMGDDIDKAFDDRLLSFTLSQDAVKRHHDLPIVYSPLYGAGNLPVRRILKKHGFTNVHVVKEQENPDGDFPTTPTPNPELPETLELAIKQAREMGADLVMATDPDADRTGVAIRTADDKFVLLSGNEIGLLLMDYILDKLTNSGKLPEGAFCVSTIVSSRLTIPICKRFDTGLYFSLTGFRHIAQEIYQHQELEKGTFLYGYEESFGYLVGDHVRDKDAVGSCLMIAEMAADSKDHGETLYDRLNRLFQTYGQAAEKTISIYREGKVGLERISFAMDQLREKPLEGFESLKSVTLSDYATSVKTFLKTGETEILHLPTSNVLLYELEGIDFMCIRPSGTEPKIKVYFGCYGDDRNACDKRLAEYEELVLQRVNRLLEN